MKPFILLLATFLLAASYTGLAAPPKSKIVKETIVFEGKKRAYYLFVPDKLDDKSPVPVLLTLHGSSNNGLSLVEKWKDIAAAENFIVAGPDSQNSQAWFAPEDGPDFLRGIIEVLKTRYPVNQRRIYLFGHSAGATMGLLMSLFESEYFAATAVHAGVLSPETYPTIAYAKRKIPLAIWVGDRDPGLPLSVVRATRDTLTAKGFSVELTVIPNHDHWYYDKAPKINRSAWEFLKKQELSGDPHYKVYQFPARTN